MRRVKKLVAAIPVAISLILGLDAIALQEAGATSSPACAEELHLAKPTPEVAAAETPALLVHGLGSDAGTWAEGTPSMKVIVDQIEGVRAVTFDYKPVNDRWVTDPAIGQKLAKTIVCYSKLYGGKKVIVVGHSMGGLAIREAESWAAYGTFVKKVTGRIVTIATPHEGSLLANAGFSFEMAVCNAQIGIFDLVDDTDELCRQSMADQAVAGLQVNSEQAARLPKFPEVVSIKAIAGDVRGRTCVVWGCSVWRSTGGDLVVSIKSATAYSTATGKGDGKKVFSCNTDRLKPKLTDAWCEHSNMLRAPQVQEEVKRSIQEYLASLAPANLHAVILFNDFKVRMLKRMTLRGYHGGEGYPSYELKCVSGPCPKLSVYSPRGAGGGSLGWQEWGWQDDCGVDKPVAKGHLLISRHRAHYYEAGSCRFWEMDDRRALFIAKDLRGTQEALLVDAMLASIIW